jgi:tetratricopeptide (TPR) repeat protein
MTKKSAEKPAAPVKKTRSAARLSAPVQKQLSNPVSTGGAGASYESRVQAVYLLAMYAGLPTAVFPEATIISLQFQAKIHDYETDDLVCTLKDQLGLSHKVLLQVKRTAKAIASNAAFSEAVTAAWLDFNNPVLFLAGRDRLVLVYDGLQNSELQGAAAISNFARTSLSGEEFCRKSTAEKFSSETNRGAFKAIVGILANIIGGPSHIDELHQFVKHLWFVSHGLSSDGTQEYVSLLGNIELVLGRTLANNPQGIWAELVNACQKLNSVAGSVSFVNLDEQISSRVAAGFKLHREGSAAALPLGGLTPAAIQSSSLAARTGEMLIHGAALTQVPTLHGAATSAPISIVLSTARPGSVNKVITAQLDAIGEKLKQCHYRDAQVDLSAIGKDIGPFDEHQKARWYQQRGICSWQIGSAEDAAADFIKAAELSNEDEKMVAARIRGLMLLKQTEASIAAGKAAIERFPESLHVWLALANAKMLRGDSLGLTDAPASIRGEAEVLQMLAWGYHFKGKSDEAIKFSLQALQAPAAGFFTRHAALVMIVEAAMNDGVLSIYQLIPDSMRHSLLQVTSAFNPRVDKLWDAQAPETVATTAAYLGCAYLLLANASTALTIVQEANAHDSISPGLLRVELDALSQLGRTQDLLKQGRAHVHQLAADGLIGLAQAAGNLGDVQLVEECIVSATKIEAIEPRVTDILRAIRWMSILRTPARTAIIVEVKTAELEVSESLSLIVAGARVLLWAGEAEAAELAIARAMQVVTHSNSTEGSLVLAELLFDTKKFEQAIGYYEDILPKKQHSELHNRLLCCYLNTSATQKAKQLLESFPPGWAEDDDTRSLAIELGQNVGDWKLLTTLADTQFKKRPTHVSSWLFKFMVDIRRKSVSELQQFIKEAPLELKGSLQQTTQFAGLELKYGLESNGMRRMYRLRRLNIDDVESASALVISFITATERLPNMETGLAEVGPGTSVELRDQQGGAHVITIDPAELQGLPSTTEFKPATSSGAEHFIGAIVGSTVTIEGPFGATREYTVEAISSAYHRLLQSAFKAVDESVTPASNLMSMSLPTSADGETDFSQMKAQLQRSSAYGKQVFTQYETMPLTLGCMCRMLGKNPIDIVRSWPTKRVALISCNGTPTERSTAKELLEDPSESYIIDSATLTELVWLDCASVLALLPNLYVSTITRDIVYGKLEDAKGNRSAGQAFDDDGRLGYIEYTEANHLVEIEQLEAISAALDKYCNVLPAYGPDVPNKILVGLKDLISHEEHSSLMLAVEKEAVFVTLDGHLRQWATAAHVRSVWPQVLLMHAAIVGSISAENYSLAAAKLFMSNRSFTSFSSYDLLMMCYQGDNWLQFGFSKYVHHLSHPNTEFASAFRITMEFVHRVANSLAQLGALAELIRHIVAGLLRHKDCPSDVIIEMDGFLESLLNRNIFASYYPPAAAAAQQGYRLRLKILKDSVREGEAWANDYGCAREIKVKVLMCGRTPWLISGKD